MTYKNKLKMTIVGCASTGKTSIISRLLRNEFGNTESTVGASFFTMVVNEIKYEIWDTAGSERFLSLAPMYYRGTNILIITYDVSDLSTIDRLETYFNMIENTLFQIPRIIVVGNKIDLLSGSNIDNFKIGIQEKISKMTNEEINNFVYTSAKTGAGISELKAVITGNGELIGNTATNTISLTTKPIETDKCSC